MIGIAIIFCCFPNFPYLPSSNPLARLFKIAIESLVLTVAEPVLLIKGNQSFHFALEYAVVIP